MKIVPYSITAVLALNAALLPQPAEAVIETYKIDPTHSAVSFKVRHFFTKVPGNFVNFEGTIVVDKDNLTNSKVEAVIKADSINTRNVKRDKHLRSDDFFKTENYSFITFKSTKWEQNGENTFKVTGILTIMETVKEVVLDVTLLGFGKGSRERHISGWEATTTLDRTDFGITYGPAVIGSEVFVEIAIEAQLQ